MNYFLSPEEPSWPKREELECALSRHSEKCKMEPPSRDVRLRTIREPLELTEDERLLSGGESGQLSGGERADSFRILICHCKFQVQVVASLPLSETIRRLANDLSS